MQPRDDHREATCLKHILCYEAPNVSAFEKAVRTERAQPALRVFTMVTTSFSPKLSTGTRLAPVARATFTNPFLQHNLVNAET